MDKYNSQTALGLVETYGYIGHIEAADSCLKAANVRLIGSEKVKGGYMLVKIAGDVGAVKAAVDAAKAAVEALKLKAVTHVIPRPAQEVQKLILEGQAECQKVRFNIAPADKDKSEPNKDIPPAEIENKQPEKKEKKMKVQKSKPDEPTEEVDKLELDEKALSQMTVVKLRVIARSLENVSLDKNQINFGKKQELIKAILDCLRKEGKPGGDI